MAFKKTILKRSYSSIVSGHIIAQDDKEEQDQISVAVDLSIKENIKNDIKTEDWPLPCKERQKGRPCAEGPMNSSSKLEGKIPSVEAKQQNMQPSVSRKPLVEKVINQGQSSLTMKIASPSRSPSKKKAKSSSSDSETERSVWQSPRKKLIYPKRSAEGTHVKQFEIKAEVKPFRFSQAPQEFAQVIDSDDSLPDMNTALAMHIEEKDSLQVTGYSNDGNIIVLSDTDTASNDDSSSSVTVIDDAATANYQSETFFQGDPTLPFFCKDETRGRRTRKMAALIIFNQIADEFACTNVPLNVNLNCGFCVKQSSLKHWRDILSDDMGSYYTNGAHPMFFSKEGGELVTADPACAEYKTMRYSFVNNEYPDVHKIVIRVENINGCSHKPDILFLQYIFDSAPHDVYPTKPHGNSKKHKQPYLRTQKSVHQSIKASKSCGKKAFHEILTEKGGLDNLRSKSEIPTSSQHVMSLQSRCAFKTDALLETLEMKNDPKFAKFIRSIKSSPDLCVLLASDEQLSLLEMNCTNKTNFSVLGVDTTFNVGKFFVTILTFKHKMLITRDTGIEPVIIGPILIHQKKDFDSYFELSSGIIRLNNELKNVVVFGTDGDVALSSSFSVMMGDAYHLLCDLHMRDNISAKMVSLHFPKEQSADVLKDIFGYKVGDHSVKGLVDCTDETLFHTQVNELGEKWSEFGDHGAKFFEYFVDFKAQLIKNCMSADLRAKCGLGFPPKPYTQNPNECINSTVKRVFGKEKLPLHECVIKLDEIITMQKEEIELSIISAGSFKIKDEYKMFQIDLHEYRRKTDVQKQHFKKRFFTSKLFDSNMGGFEPRSSGEDTSTHILVTPLESGIKNIHNFVLEQIFAKANTLLKEGKVVKSPGIDDQFIVASSSNVRNPHIVNINKSKYVMCDNSCQNFQGYKFCSHALAVAQFSGNIHHYLSSVKKQKKGNVNLTELVETNVPANTGKKATKATQRRRCPRNVNPTETFNYFPNDQTIRPNESIPNPQPAPNTYELYLLKFCSKNVKKCFGCGGNVKNDDGSIPPIPRDLIIVSKENRDFILNGSQQSKLGNTYYHFNEQCILRKNCIFLFSLVIVSKQIARHLHIDHRELLKKAAIVIPDPD